MDDTRTAADLAAQKRLQTQRRAKRGLIAGYIHGLSVRHRGDGGQRPAPAELSRTAADRMRGGDRGGVLERL